MKRLFILLITLSIFITFHLTYYDTKGEKVRIAKHVTLKNWDEVTIEEVENIRRYYNAKLLERYPHAHFDIVIIHWDILKGEKGGL